MAQRRLWLVLLGLLLLNSEPTESHEFFVGDNGGWNFGVDSWPINKVFYEGNVLVFKYSTLIHNVVRVDNDGYERCRTNENSEKYNSGEDHIELYKGTNYFICSFPGHCQGGMRMAIEAI